LNYLKIRKSEPVVLIVEGSIGAGKSTLINEITKRLDRDKRTYKKYDEKDITESELLEKYYENPYEYGYMLQEQVVNNRRKQMEESKEWNNYEFIIFDRTVLSTRIFTKLQYHSGYISFKQEDILIRKTNKYLTNKYLRNAIVAYCRSKEETE